MKLRQRGSRIIGVCAGGRYKGKMRAVPVFRGNGRSGTGERVLIGGWIWGGGVVSRAGGHRWPGVVARGAVPRGVLRRCAAAGAAFALMSGACAAAQTVLASPVSAASSRAATIAAGSAYRGEVIISQFRLSGPGGADDQYVELYNTGLPVSLAGFRLAAGSGASITVPGSAPVVPTDQAYLIAGGGYSLSAIAAADLSAPSLGSDGLQVTAPDGTVVDAVGPAGAPAGFSSGTPLPAMSIVPADEYAWVRAELKGVPADSGSNAADFTLVSTTGDMVGGLPSALGSPSPRASGSPSQANGAFQSILLDPAAPAPDAPNVDYVRGSPGLLTVRRTITNTSNDHLIVAKIRITSLSEVNGAPEPGVASQPGQPAALRIVDPATPTSQVTVGGNLVTVQNLSVDAPVSANPGGGGLGSTLSVPPSAGDLVPGASADIAVTFAVDRGGSYWFGYDVDYLTVAHAAPALGSRAARPAFGVSSPRAASVSRSLPGADRAPGDAGGTGVLR